MGLKNPETLQRTTKDSIVQTTYSTLEAGECDPFGPKVITLIE